MKFKQVLNELSSMELTSSTPIKKIGDPREKQIINAIELAINSSDQLKKEFAVVKDDVFDVTVNIEGPNCVLTLVPEDGEKKSVGTFPLSYLMKSVREGPKSLANMLLKSKDQIFK